MERTELAEVLSSQDNDSNETLPQAQRETEDETPEEIAEMFATLGKDIPEAIELYQTALDVFGNDTNETLPQAQRETRS